MTDLQKDLMVNQFLACLPDNLSIMLADKLAATSCFEYTIWVEPGSGNFTMTPAVVEYIIEALKEQA